MMVCVSLAVTSLVSAQEPKEAGGNSETPATDASPQVVLSKLRGIFGGKSDDEIIQTVRRYAYPEQRGIDGEMNWLTQRLRCARKQWEAGSVINRFGGYVEREYAMDTSGKGRVAVPPRLRKSLGEDFFASVVEARVVNDAGMEHLKALPQLKRLGMGVTYVGNVMPGDFFDKGNQYLQRVAKGEVTDAGLKNLEGLAQVESVYFAAANVRVTDAGLVRLESLPCLRRLTFCRTAITDKGLARIAEKLPKLEFLEMHGTKTTEGGVEKFKQALKKCEVAWTKDYGM